MHWQEFLELVVIAKRLIRDLGFVLEGWLPQSAGEYFVKDTKTARRHMRKVLVSVFTCADPTHDN